MLRFLGKGENLQKSARISAKLRKSLFSTSISGEFRGTQGNSEETPNLGTFGPILGVIFLHFEGFLSFSWDFQGQEAVMQFANPKGPKIEKKTISLEIFNLD